VYNLLLDQAWMNTSIDSAQYVINWIERRYGPTNTTPEILQAWDLLRQSVYNNTYSTGVNSVVKSIFVSPLSQPLYNFITHFSYIGTPTKHDRSNKSNRSSRNSSVLRSRTTNFSMDLPRKFNNI